MFSGSCPTVRWFGQDERQGGENRSQRVRGGSHRAPASFWHAVLSLTAPPRLHNHVMVTVGENGRVTTTTFVVTDCLSRCSHRRLFSDIRYVRSPLSNHVCLLRHLSPARNGRRSSGHSEPNMSWDRGPSISKRPAPGTRRAVRFPGSTCGHSSESTSDGHRRPPYRLKAMMVFHVSLALDISLSMASRSTKCCRAVKSATGILTSANGFSSIIRCLRATCRKVLQNDNLFAIVATASG